MKRQLPLLYTTLSVFLFVSSASYATEEQSEKSQLSTAATMKKERPTTFSNLSLDVIAHIASFLKQDDVRNLRLVNFACSTVKAPSLCAECYLIKKIIQQCIEPMNPAQFRLILTTLQLDPTISPGTAAQSCTHYCKLIAEKACSLLTARSLSSAEKTMICAVLCHNIEIFNDTRSPWVQLHGLGSYTPLIQYHKTGIVKFLNSLKKYHGFNDEMREIIQWFLCKTSRISEPNAFYQCIHWISHLPWNIFGIMCHQEGTVFGQLPSDVLRKLASFLKKHDAKNLRLTNKQCALSIPAQFAQGKCDCIICYLGLEKENNNA